MDYRDRLTEVDHYAAYGDQSDQTVQYAYDYANRLVSRTLDADGAGGTADVQKSVYVYDGDQVALQFDHGGAGNAAADDLSHRYLWNPQAVDQLFADEQVHYDREGEELVTDQLLWTLTDHQNTVRDLAVYDSGAERTAVATHRVFDAFGKQTWSTSGGPDCLLGYTARPFDAVTGLQNNLEQPQPLVRTRHRQVGE